VLDFGLAHLVGAGRLAEGGTRRYMPPEQRAGLAQDGRTDVFSAALLLYESLGGALLEDGTGATALPLPPPPHHDLPAGLAALLAQGTAAGPAERPADGADWLTRLLALRRADLRRE
jgi:serine/threonine-protein kinase